MKWLHWKERSKAREHELNEEIAANFALEIQQRMEAGATREEAEFAARRDFGNVTRVKEVTREMWGWTFLERLAQDTRHVLRRLRKAPAFTVATILTLALGIGATTAIFSVVNGVLLKPLPYPHPGRLVAVRLNLPGINESNWPLSQASYFIFRGQSRTFQDIGLYNSALLSGYKSKRLNWLAESHEFSWESDG